MINLLPEPFTGVKLRHFQAGLPGKSVIIGAINMRVILADHHEQPRWALKTFLEEQPELILVGEAADVKELLMVIDEHKADLVLMERELPGSPIGDLIASIHALQPRPIVIVMSTEIEYSQVSLKAGADAFVSKGDHPEWLLEKLHQYETSG